MKEWFIMLWGKIVAFFTSEAVVTNIKEIVAWILGIILTVLVSAIMNKVIGYFKLKNKSEKTAQTLEKIRDIIVKCCNTTTQTYVETLKKARSFDATRQQEALKMTIENAKTALTDDLKKVIKEQYGDIDNFITLQIEDHLHGEKTSK